MEMQRMAKFKAPVTPDGAISIAVIIDQQRGSMFHPEVFRCTSAFHHPQIREGETESQSTEANFPKVRQ